VKDRLKEYRGMFDIPEHKEPYIKDHVIPTFPAPYESCQPINSSKFYLIHATKDRVVPFSEFELNKKDLCIPDINTLIFDDIPSVSFQTHDINHVLPFYLKRTKQFIQDHLK